MGCRGRIQEICRSARPRVENLIIGGVGRRHLSIPNITKLFGGVFSLIVITSISLPFLNEKQDEILFDISLLSWREYCPNVRPSYGRGLQARIMGAACLCESDSTASAIYSLRTGFMPSE